ncbi:hypothetical protein [Luteolibacter sp. LG18]|uniref:hypothetical protein n=1 Tax=Luteolibacter sp. LG18 TaxID=2819286 RepID=UPI0030C6D902
MARTVGRAGVSGLLAWGASAGILLGCDMAYTWGSIDPWRTLRFVGIWTGIALAVTCVMVILPVYVWAPDRLRRWSLGRKALLGGAIGAVVPLVMLGLFREIRGGCAAAIVSGMIVGVLLPKQDPDAGNPG